MKKKKTLVIGATPNPGRYGYLAVKRLKKFGHEVIPLGIRDGEIEGIPIVHGKPEFENIDTITIYINPFRQEEYYDYLLDLKPQRMIFNPGSENHAFIWRAKLEGVEVVAGCTLVMLATGQY